MARGKKAAQAANRRAAAETGLASRAQSEAKAARAAMAAMEVRHRAEAQRQAHEHLANLDRLVDERYGQVLEQAVADAVSVRTEAIRAEARRESFDLVKKLMDDGVIGIREGKVTEAARELAKAAGFDLIGMGQGDSRYMRRLRQHNARQLAAIVDTTHKSKRPDGAPV